MKYVIYPVAILTICLSMSLAAAQNKVVVIPLNSCNDSNLVPENICEGVTICGITGTQFCAYGTVTSAGQAWMDRNLGATRVATSITDTEAYGDLYQWGRLADGHQSRTSPTISTLSTTDFPGHGSFITNNIIFPYDWRSSQNDNLWQGATGTNNPCPAGFRLPTDIELETEFLSWSSQDDNGAFASPLKLVPAGVRNIIGTLLNAGGFGYYWSSTVSTVNVGSSRYLGFGSGYVGMDSHFRANGFSVRCLKD